MKPGPTWPVVIIVPVWFTKWLISLGVDETTAGRDACKVEHDLSEESFEAIKNKIPNI